MTDNPLWRWFDDTFLDLGRQFRWSYLPPLMIYLAAGVSGLTSIVGTFFIKEYLDLSAAFLAGLAFWAGIPWTLKMPIGHLVDLIWRRKALLVYLGASLIALSILLMYAIIAHTETMAEILKVEAWFVIATILAPTGYVLQDVVADAMTVEAVPTIDEQGNAYPEPEIKTMHTTMQTLGRVAIIGGLIGVAALNITMFEGVEDMTEEMKVAIYADIYLLALVIPLISVMGVILGGLLLRRRARQMEALGHDHSSIDKLLFAPAGEISPNWWILGGSLVFAVFTVTMGVSDVPLAQEIIFLGSMSIILFLMYRLLLELEPEARNMLIGTAIIIFVFRAVPLPGPGLAWFEIDVLDFDQQFLSVLSLIASALTLAGLVVLRPMMARRSIVFVIVILTIAAGILSLPNIGLYYGVHEWTAAHTGDIVDARFIALIDTAIESPLGQIAMIPMLAWIAKNAPSHLKATFFAVMASFTNLALSASSLGTKYVNEIYTVTREVRDRVTDVIQTTADYSELGWLLVSVALIGVAAPLITVMIIQDSPLRTHQ
ncbi:MAG: folate/biopterin family MFS transporter [Gammaproteobacteria bacterium]|nr:folate/biopterin family MFS transporter [Gammaproteobacteria bacterium]